jgi:hypothetical protein
MMRSVGIHGSCLAGLGLIIYAGWLAWPPLAFGATGALLCAFGVFVHKGGK